MFQYLHWPEDWGREIARQLTRIRYQVLLVTDAREFDELETSLFQFQNRGGHIDLLIGLQPEEKTIRRINALKRLSRAGANTGIIQLQMYQQLPGNVAVLDKARLLTDYFLDDAGDPRELIFQQEKKWQQWFEQAEQIIPSADTIQIHFQTTTSYLYPGSTVKLYWDVQYADHVEILPDIGPVEAAGNLEIPVLQDTLFQLVARNQASARSQSIFIKTISQEPIMLEVEVWDSLSDAYIQLESAYTERRVFGVFSGDKVRIRWQALPSGELSESRLGVLPLSGMETLQVFAEEHFIFTLQTTYEVLVYELTILPVPELKGSSVPVELPEHTVPTFPSDPLEENPGRPDSFLKRFLNWFSWR